MTHRISFQEIPQDLLNGLFKLSGALKKTGIDMKLAELMFYRASQINKCAMCLDMHHKELIHMGETEQRIHGVIAWAETPYYTEKEQAALALTEALTNINHDDVDDELFAKLKKHFSNEEIATLTIAIGQINIWNRINRAFKTVPGGYQVGQF